MSVARCTGMAQACASVSPSTVKRLAEVSSPSFTIGEKELRSSVSSISLAMPSSLLRMTSVVIGSTTSARANVFIEAPSFDGMEVEGAAAVDLGAPAALDHGGRIGLLHDGRPV